MATKRQTQKTGQPVDASGGPTIDPTENVKALSEASNIRQDDLREASDKYNAIAIQHTKEIAALHAGYAEKLSVAESKRIDAIRAVDVNAVAIASERQSAQAGVLATQVIQSADALRALVSSTAQTIAEQNRQQFSQMNDRITAVERTQYEGRGKGLVSDPMLAEMAADMKRLTALMATGSGKSEAVKDYTGYIFLVIGALIGLAGLAFAVLK